MKNAKDKKRQKQDKRAAALRDNLRKRKEKQKSAAPEGKKKE